MPTVSESVSESGWGNLKHAPERVESVSRWTGNRGWCAKVEDLRSTEIASCRNFRFYPVSPCKFAFNAFLHKVSRATNIYKRSEDLSFTNYIQRSSSYVI